MQNTIRALALSLALLPTLAVAQVSNTILQQNTVVGRTEIGSGPAEAVPFSKILLGISTICPTHQWLNTVSITPTCAQPAAGDIAGFGTGVPAALGNPINAAGGLLGFGAAAGGDLSGTYPNPGVAKTGGVAFGPYSTASLGQLPGTTGATPAASGNIGEGFDQSATVSLTSGTSVNVTSKLIPAGEWEISASLQFLGTGSTVTTDARASIGTTVTTVNATLGVSAHFRNAAGVTDNNFTPTIGPTRASLASATTFFCNAVATFTVSTYSASCNIHAVRAH